MPDIIAPNEGKADLLAYMIKSSISGVGAWDLMLWKNNITPTVTSVYADLTESTFGGYARTSLVRATWTSPTIDGSNRAVSTWSTTPIVWIVTSGTETIYGYAMVTTSSPVIRFVQRFDTPVAVTTGGVFALLPQLKLGALA